MVRDRLLLFGVSGFFVGVLWCSFFRGGFSVAGFVALLALALMMVLGKRGAQTKFAPLFFIALFMLGFSGGMARFVLSEKPLDTMLASNIGAAVSVSGTIIDEPDEREDSVRYTILLSSLSHGTTTIPVSGTALSLSPLYPKFSYGDIVSLRGKLIRPHMITDSSGNSFDYGAFLATAGISYQFIRPDVTVVSHHNASFLFEKLFLLKHVFMDSVSKVIPEPHASLLGGLVIGAKQSLGKSLLEDFRRAGVVHIVVLSGYNITIVAEALIKMFSFLPRFFGYACGAGGIVLFAIMTGGSATVVRASIMALLVLIARATGRPYSVARALLFAGFAMVLHNPRILVFDSSFQLSFMSSLALLFVAPLVERKFIFVTEWWGLRSIVVSTLATQIFVLPMLLYKMGELSLVGLPVNMLILSVIPITMFVGFLTGVVGLFSTAVAYPCALITYGLLSYILGVVLFFARLPIASVSVDGFSWWLAVLMYVLYGAYLWRVYAKENSTPREGAGRKIFSDISDPY